MHLQNVSGLFKIDELRNRNQVFTCHYLHDRTIGIVLERLGANDPDGHFIVEKGYKGMQREVLMPGRHFLWHTTLFAKVLKVPMTVIPAGKVGVLIAQDGRPLKEGQKIAEEDEIDPGTGKLINMGEKGVRKTLLRPGTYPINTEYFTVEIHDSLTIEPGKVGVLTRKIGDPAPPDQMLVPQNSPYRGVIEEVIQPGILYLHPYIYAWEIVDEVAIPEGRVGVVTRKIGKSPPADMKLIERESEYRGMLKQVLEPGTYSLNPYGFDVQVRDAVSLPDGFVREKARP